MSQQAETKTLPPKPAHFTEAIRRIVTSHDEGGKVVVQSDEQIPLKVRLSRIHHSAGSRRFEHDLDGRCLGGPVSFDMGDY